MNRIILNWALEINYKKKPDEIRRLIKTIEM